MMGPLLILDHKECPVTGDLSKKICHINQCNLAHHERVKVLLKFCQKSAALER
jgi:hypothetical protein